MVKEAKAADATDGANQNEVSEKIEEKKAFDAIEIAKKVKEALVKTTDDTQKSTDTSEDREPVEKTKAATEKAKKTRKKYSVINKNTIVNIIDNCFTDAATISNKFNISLSTARKIIKLLSRDNWQPKNTNSAPPVGYFLSKKVDGCVQAAMYDKGMIKTY